MACAQCRGCLYLCLGAREPRTTPVMLPVTALVAETGALAHCERPLSHPHSTKGRPQWLPARVSTSVSGAVGGRAVAVLCLMPRTAPGVSAESLRLSPGAQTQLCRAHTQALGTSVLSMSCPKTGLWKVGGSQDPQKSQARSLCWVSGQASIHISSP